MIWQFGEFGYDVQLNNDRLAIKPTKWEYLNNPERMRLFKLYKEMIGLKDDHIAFNKPSNTTISLESTVNFNSPSSEFLLFTSKPHPKSESGIVQ